MFADIVETQAALETPWDFGIDLRIYDDDRLRERRGVFDFLRGGPGLGRAEGLVFDDGLEAFEVGEGDGAAGVFPRGGLDAGSDEINETLFVALLSPATDDENERLGDFALAERVAEIDGRAVFRGLGIHGRTAVGGIRRRGMSHFWV